MNRNIKRIISVLIAIIMMFCALSVFAEETANEQIKETNVTWEQIDDVLYINGTGDMYINYQYITEIPWYNLKSEISKVIIADGITSIYNYAFVDFTNLKEVVLPNSIKVIGESSFMTCTSLESITLPYKITTVGAGAFCNCTNLKTVIIPGSIVEISTDAFYDCKNIKLLGVGGTYLEEFAKKTNLPFEAGLEASEEILVRVNGTYVDFDQPPVIVNDRTLVPMRKIFETMGIEVTWIPETRTVIAKRNDISISLVIDTTIIHKTVGKETNAITIDVPAQIVGDRTMVPARAIAESFLADVDWDGLTRTVIVLD